MNPKKFDLNNIRTFTTSDPFRRSDADKTSPAASASAASVKKETIDRSAYPFAPSLEQLRAARMRVASRNFDLQTHHKRIEEWARTGYQPTASTKEDDDRMIREVEAMLSAGK